MALLHILTLEAEEESLRKRSRPLDGVTDRTRILLDDLYETMQDANGVGLAAPQVGVLRRVVVIDVGEGRIDLVNPEIVSAEGEQEDREGCLSVPEECGIVKRPMKVTVRALDRNGKPITVTGEGLLARALCHEIDHLDGVLYVDKASRMLTPEEMDELEEG